MEYRFNKNQPSRLLPLVAVILWAALIFSLSSIPGLHSGLSKDFLLRKIAHVTEFFILSYLLYRAFATSFSLKKGLLFFCVGGLCLLYAISDELHQSFVPTRSPAFIDVMIDSLGFFAFLAYFGSSRTRKTVVACAFCFLLICPTIATSGEKCAACDRARATASLPVTIEKLPEPAPEPEPGNSDKLLPHAES
ncbi:MAG TPA: VanZ family protein [Candidatus Omnitrophota bacterium]|jgi:VanZ family protein|nr:VanZ family protein [Candidatus Omnitrophota bacterium]